jgi:hypothetical protein
MEGQNPSYVSLCGLCVLCGKKLLALKITTHRKNKPELGNRRNFYLQNHVV